jgi:hypothetical protein
MERVGGGGGVLQQTATVSIDLSPKHTGSEDLVRGTVCENMQPLTSVDSLV